MNATSFKTDVAQTGLWNLARTLSLFGLAIFAFGASAEAGQNESGINVEIRLHPKALVRGPQFTINDVAEVVSTDTELAASIQKLVISRSPWPGYTQQVNDDVLRMVLRNRVENLSQIKVSGAEACQVRTASVKVSGKTFLAAARQHLLQQLPYALEQIEIKSMETVQDRYVPRGLGQGPLLEVQNADEQKKIGLVRLRARVLVDGRPVYQTTLSFHLKLFQEVLVAGGNIHRGDLITPENVTFERREIRDFTTGFYTEKKGVYGKRAVRDIRARTMLTTKLLEIPPVIARKTMVEIIYQSRGIRIALKGIAEDAGAPGDVIRVRSISTRRQLFCQIIDSHTVQVTSGNDRLAMARTAR